METASAYSCTCDKGAWHDTSVNAYLWNVIGAGGGTNAGTCVDVLECSLTADDNPCKSGNTCIEGDQTGYQCSCYNSGDTIITNATAASDPV